ncbi:MAG: 50S ribosomal protein L18Ae [Halobacteriota archaeon]|jgi:large subunit ribosomal protein LX
MAYKTPLLMDDLSMERKTFQIIGSFKAGRSWERFTKEVSSNNEKNAAEKLYSLIGSEHGLKRNLIRIESIEVENE